MRLEPWYLSFLVLPSLILLHLWVAPFTKVEESFNIQAVHDFLTFGLSFRNAAAKIETFYDHVIFPGAVPRTFIGALALAGISNPFVQIFSLDLPAQQMLARGMLGMLCAAALLFYTAGIRHAYGKTTALWFTAFQASQFHIAFYATRTLPNTFAFAMTTFALRFTLPEPNPRLPLIKRAKLALYLMTIATIIFRAEVALLLFGYCILILLRSADSFSRILVTIRSILLPSVLTATVAGLLLTVAIDTFMWRSRRLLWPEAAAFLSNVFPPPGSQGASAWGTSPWHWYHTSALPRLIASPLLLALPPFLVLPTAIRQPLLPLVFPTLVYITLYSILPHKETRFLFPILPTINMALAIIATHLTTSLKTSTLTRRLLTITLILTTLATTLTSHLILLPLSALTYPGGHALDLLHTHIHTHADASNTSLHLSHPHNINIHLTNLALQTGVTRFLEQPPLHHHHQNQHQHAPQRDSTTGTASQWTYDKSSNATGLYLRRDFWERFDYIVIESTDVLPRNAAGDAGPGVVGFEVVAEVLALGRPRVVLYSATASASASASASTVTSTSPAAQNDGENDDDNDDEDGQRLKELRALIPGSSKGDDGVALLLRRMYGDNFLSTAAVRLYGAVKAVGTSAFVSRRITGGRWVEWEVGRALVVMRRREGGLDAGDTGSGGRGGAGVAK